MTPEITQAWLTVFTTSQRPEVPEPQRSELRQQLIDLLIALLTGDQQPAPQGRRR